MTFVLFVGQPVIIEGALTDWPARLWTLESLQERVGAAKIMVRGNTNVEDYKVGGLQSKFRVY